MAENNRYIYIVKLSEPRALDPRNYVVSDDPNIQRIYSQRLFQLSLDGTPEETSLRRDLEDYATMVSMGLTNGRVRRLEQDEHEVEVVEPGENGTAVGVYINGALTRREDYEIILRRFSQEGTVFYLPDTTYAVGYRDANYVFHATHGICVRDQGSGFQFKDPLPRVPEESLV